MKKIITVIQILCLLAGVMSSCGKETEKTPEVVKVADMLYEVTFDKYSSEIPSGSVCEEMAAEMACSCVRNGNYVGRNFDFFMKSTPTFVVRTTAGEGRYATLGVGRLTGINCATVDAGLSQEQLDILPWALLDGMNEKGLVVNSNVVPKADWGEIPHTGTKSGATELNAFFLIRPILDNCATVDEAVAYLKEFNITPFPSGKMDLHYMISDTEKTCVVEFFNNEMLVKEQTVMTNYFLNTENTPKYPIGWERAQTLRAHYDEGSTMEGMYQLMQRVRYTNAYYVANGWYSDLGLTYEQLQNVSEEAKAYLQATEAEYGEELNYVKENGFREETEWWDTVHTSIYDISAGKLWVTVHERYAEGPHIFDIKGAD